MIAIIRPREFRRVNQKKTMAMKRTTGTTNSRPETALTQYLNWTRGLRRKVSGRDTQFDNSKSGSVTRTSTRIISSVLVSKGFKECAVSFIDFLLHSTGAGLLFT